MPASTQSAITKSGTAEAKKDPQPTTGHTGDDDANTYHYRRCGHQPHKHRRAQLRPFARR